MKKLLAVSILALATAAPTTAANPPFDTPAPIAYLEDLSSGAVLYAKDADRRIPPASMAKMMTVYVAFDLIKKGELKLDQTIEVRPETWKKWHSQGSTMFLAVGEKPRVEDLLNGIVTLSGNDACVVLAEGIAGTEEAFTNLMNIQAKKLGLSNSQFGTSNGWPDEGRTFVTARDLAHLAKATIQDHPKLYKQFYSRTSYSWGKTLGAGADIVQGNRDPLLGRVDGADGLKTGHTEEAGYGFTGSAEQNGRRLVMVVAGLDSYGGRAEESVRFMEWGFRAWKSRPIVKTGAQGRRHRRAGRRIERSRRSRAARPRRDDPGGHFARNAGQDRLSGAGQGADQGGRPYRGSGDRFGGNAATGAAAGGGGRCRRGGVLPSHLAGPDRVVRRVTGAAARRGSAAAADAGRATPWN